jgi:predicted O-methyltransferase YrrM
MRLPITWSGACARPKLVATPNQPPANLHDMPPGQFIDWCYRHILMREPDDEGRRHYLTAMEAGLSRLDMIRELFESGEHRDRFAVCRLYPPGHALSPLPSASDIEAHRAFDWNPPEIPGINLRVDEQRDLLQRLAVHYPRLPYTDHLAPGRRFSYDNKSYTHADAILLGCMMMEKQPRRIIEVGSGFSSAAMLDVNDACLDGRVDFTFIDPDPSRLHALVDPHTVRARIIPSMLQDVPAETFAELQAGDFLFIDSSHVSKLGSDVNRVFFDILPALPSGVFIHIHDVLYPFEYLHSWLQRGMVWNEQYLLRAFLQYNDRFAIRLFSTLMLDADRDWFARHMPGVHKEHGGCVWLEKL